MLPVCFYFFLRDMEDFCPMGKAHMKMKEKEKIGSRGKVWNPRWKNPPWKGRDPTSSERRDEDKMKEGVQGVVGEISAWKELKENQVIG